MKNGMKNEEGRIRKTACGRSVELVQGVYTNEEWSNFGALVWSNVCVCGSFSKMRKQRHCNVCVY
ncbi:hypothetical protein CsSME_00020239 [Camellia sinensis var. sinensis]